MKRPRFLRPKLAYMSYHVELEPPWTAHGILFDGSWKRIGDVEVTGYKTAIMRIEVVTEYGRASHDYDHIFDLKEEISWLAQVAGLRVPGKLYDLVSLRTWLGEY